MLPCGYQCPVEFSSLYKSHHGSTNHLEGKKVVCWNDIAGNLSFPMACRDSKKQNRMCQHGGGRLKCQDLWRSPFCRETIAVLIGIERVLCEIFIFTPPCDSIDLPSNIRTWTLQCQKATLPSVQTPSLVGHGVMSWFTWHTVGLKNHAWEEWGGVSK